MKNQLVLSDPLGVVIIDNDFVLSSDGAGRAGLGSINESY